MRDNSKCGNNNNNNDNNNNNKHLPKYNEYDKIRKELCLHFDVLSLAVAFQQRQSNSKIEN